jgi:hypothetical protein
MNNLLFSQSVTYTADSFGNQVPAGLTTYATTQPGAAQNIAWGGITSCLQNASGTGSQQGTWNFPADYWQDQSYFYTSVPMVAQEPGGAQDTPETWHTATNANGWAVQATGLDLKYALMPDGNVKMTGRLTCGTTFSGSQAVIAAVPTSYRPARNEPVWCYGHNASSPYAGVSVFGVMLTTGVLTLYGAMNAGQNLEIQCSYPLNA